MCSMAHAIERPESDGQRTRRWSIGFGIAVPYLYKERLYYPDLIDATTTLPIERTELWRNAFARLGSVGMRLNPIQVGYQVSESFTVSLGGWSRGPYGHTTYMTSYARAYFTTTWMPLGSKRIRLQPTLGVVVAWDGRYHEYHTYSSYDSYSTTKTSSNSAGLTLGIRWKLKRFLIDAELNAALVAAVDGRFYQQNYYSDVYGTTGSFQKTLGPAQLLQDGYAFGPAAIRAAYTF